MFVEEDMIGPPINWHFWILLRLLLMPPRVRVCAIPLLWYCCQTFARKFVVSVVPKGPEINASLWKEDGDEALGLIWYSILQWRRKLFGSRGCIMTKFAHFFRQIDTFLPLSSYAWGACARILCAPLLTTPLSIRIRGSKPDEPKTQTNIHTSLDNTSYHLPKCQTHLEILICANWARFNGKDISKVLLKATNKKIKKIWWVQKDLRITFKIYMLQTYLTSLF